LPRGSGRPKRRAHALALNSVECGGQRPTSSIER
jgi:hypothetical protein